MKSWRVVIILLALACIATGFRQPACSKIISRTYTSSRCSLCSSPRPSPRIAAPAAFVRAALAVGLAIGLSSGPVGPLAAVELRPGTVVEEAWTVVDRHYLDRTFGGNDWGDVRERFVPRGGQGTKKDLETAQEMLSLLGDRYTRLQAVVDSDKTLSKYDVTGLQLNLVRTGEDTIVANAPTADSAAGMGGIKQGDIVRAVNGQDTAGMTPFVVLETLQATTPEGQPVKLDMEAEGGRRYSVALNRNFATVPNPVSKYEMTTKNGEKVGYLRLKNFNARCARDMAAAIGEMEAHGVDSYILDLRGNPGGVLEGAIEIAGQFMGKADVLSVQDSHGEVEAFTSKGSRLTADPLVVWVDGGSASASEVLSAALQDNCRATVLGETTYGKGVIQGVFSLSEGNGALITTVAKYLTPAGREINAVGVAPDVRSTLLSSVLPFREVLMKDIADTKFTPSTTCAAQQ